MRLSRTLAAPACAAALVCFALSGCGLNVAPQPADSTTSDAEPASITPQMPVASTNYTPPPSDSPGPSGMAGMHGAEGATPPETDYSSYDPAGQASPSGEAMHAAVTDGTEGAGDFPDERMHAAQTPPNAGVDPAAMERERQNQFPGGELPGGPGAGPEAAGGEGGRGGSSRAGQFEEGSAPHVVMLMVEAIDAGDVETAAKYISDDADGLLGQVRDGEAGDNQLRELQSYFATMDPLSQRPSGRSITLNFNGAQGKVLSFVVTREGREFLVESMTVRDAPRRR